mmetsp:Transcript_25743/g.34398  ORF Transcript_25743/g.34398 Transcript_25743/m.34398 type:complete len:132 (+) Transcript_25743:3343-3738(+)
MFKNDLSPPHVLLEKIRGAKQLKMGQIFRLLSLRLDERIPHLFYLEFILARAGLSEGDLGLVLLQIRASLLGNELLYFRDQKAEKFALKKQDSRRLQTTLNCSSHSFELLGVWAGQYDRATQFGLAALQVH